MTELDGSLSIDTLKFADYFKSNPSDFAALTQNRVTSGNPLVQATGTGSLYKAGTYDLSLTSADNRQTFTAATLDGTSMVLKVVFKGDSANTLESLQLAELRTLDIYWKQPDKLSKRLFKKCPYTR